MDCDLKKIIERLPKGFKFEKVLHDIHQQANGTIYDYATMIAWRSRKDFDEQNEDGIIGILTESDL